jgi:hypothetical protein
VANEISSNQLAHLQRTVGVSYLLSPPAADAPTTWLAHVNRLTIRLLRGVAATTIAVLVLRA